MIENYHNGLDDIHSNDYNGGKPEYSPRFEGLDEKQVNDSAIRVIKNELLAKLLPGDIVSVRIACLGGMTCWLGCILESPNKKESTVEITKGDDGMTINLMNIYVPEDIILKILHEHKWNIEKSLEEIEKGNFSRLSYFSPYWTINLMSQVFDEINKEIKNCISNSNNSFKMSMGFERCLNHLRSANLSKAIETELRSDIVNLLAIFGIDSDISVNSRKLYDKMTNVDEVFTIMKVSLAIRATLADKVSSSSSTSTSINESSQSENPNIIVNSSGSRSASPEENREPSSDQIHVPSQTVNIIDNKNHIDISDKLSISSSSQEDLNQSPLKRLRKNSTISNSKTTVRDIGAVTSTSDETITHKPQVDNPLTINFQNLGSIGMDLKISFTGRKSLVTIARINSSTSSSSKIDSLTVGDQLLRLNGKELDTVSREDILRYFHSIYTNKQTASIVFQTQSRGMDRDPALPLQTAANTLKEATHESSSSSPSHEDALSSKENILEEQLTAQPSTKQRGRIPKNLSVKATKSDTIKLSAASTKVTIRSSTPDMAREEEASFDEDSPSLNKETDSSNQSNIIEWRKRFKIGDHVFAKQDIGMNDSEGVIVGFTVCRDGVWQSIQSCSSIDDLPMVSAHIKWSTNSIREWIELIPSLIMLQSDKLLTKRTKGGVNYSESKPKIKGKS